jgi:hypothetical protein
MNIRPRNLGGSLLFPAIGFRVRFMSCRNGVNPAEPTVKIDIGAAF